MVIMLLSTHIHKDEYFSEMHLVYKNDYMLQKNHLFKISIDEHPQHHHGAQTLKCLCQHKRRSYCVLIALGAIKLSVLLWWIILMTGNCRVFVNGLETVELLPLTAQQREEPPAIATPAGSFGLNVSDYGVNKNSSLKSTPSDVGVDDSLTEGTAQLPEEQDTKHPSEIQKAVCTVTAGEVKASAQAVTTKTLKGVCGTAEMNLAFHNLESKLYKELEDIKLLLQQVLTQNTVINRNERYNPEQTMTEAMPILTTTTTTTARPYPLKFQPIAMKSDLKQTKFEKFDKSTKSAALLNSINESKKSKMYPNLKSLPSHGENRDTEYIQPPREEEVNKFNNTMLSDQDMKVFTYYWKLENFTAHIENGLSGTVESPVFSIRGKPLHIKAYFQHLNRDYLYLQLEYATLKASNRNNIILDTGGIFKEINSEKIIFKHKISILDQNNQRSKDLVSQEFNNLEKGFLIPNSALSESPFIKNDALLIQLFLYL